jgi:hypothetical protein
VAKSGSTKKAPAPLPDISDDKKTHKRSRKTAKVKPSASVSSTIKTQTDAPQEIKNRFSGDNVPAFLLQAVPGKKKSNT